MITTHESLFARVSQTVERTGLAIGCCSPQTHAHRPLGHQRIRSWGNGDSSMPRAYAGFNLHYPRFRRRTKRGLWLPLSRASILEADASRTANALAYRRLSVTHPHQLSAYYACHRKRVDRSSLSARWR